MYRYDTCRLDRRWIDIVFVVVVQISFFVTIFVSQAGQCGNQIGAKFWEVR